jgi:hypothetical protein
MLTILKTAAPVRLKSPEVLKEVPLPDLPTQRLAPLKKEFKAMVDRLAGELMQLASSADYNPDAYAEKLEHSLKFGRKAADHTSRLVRRFVANNFDGLEASPAYAAVGTLRSQFGDLNPNNPDDLLETDKILGLLPIQRKLSSYFKQYQAAVPAIKGSLAELRAARLALESEAKALGQDEDELWTAMMKLEAATYFANTLGSDVEAQAAAALASNPEQAVSLTCASGTIKKAFDAWSLQQMTNANTYHSAEALKKAYSELIAGLKQIEASSMATLAAAQTASGAAGFKLNAMPVLAESVAGVSGKSSGRHGLDDLASDPHKALSALRATTSSALYAMRELDAFRFQAIGVVKQNDKLLHSIIESARLPKTELGPPCHLASESQSLAA